jgi:hypothetical protein
MLQEQAHEELEEEDDDDPVFVLTDEWREFFAKSEAKRKLGSSSSLCFFHILWKFQFVIICAYVLQRRSRLRRRGKNKYRIWRHI